MKIFRRSTYSDEEIIDGLKAGGVSEEKVLEVLYKNNLKIITNHIIKNSGNKDVAKDIFQDILVVFCEQVKTGRFQYQSGTKISTYLFMLSKRLWINELKKTGREHEYKNRQAKKENIQNENYNETTPLYRVLADEKQLIVKQFMAELEEVCRKILIYSIFEELPMKEICVKMGFKNEAVAKSKKYKCKEALKKIILNSPQLSQTLNELKYNA